jgi:hypothetical protein
MRPHPSHSNLSAGSGVPQVRNVSQPSPPSALANEFGNANASVPRSQSMGFNRMVNPLTNGNGNGSDRPGLQKQIQENDQSRMNLSPPNQNAQSQNQRDRNGIPRSGSMPLNRHSPQPSSIGTGQSTDSSPANSLRSDGANLTTPVSSQLGNGRSTSGNGPESNIKMSGGPVNAVDGSARDTSLPWMREFDAVVELIALQPLKTYAAGPPQLEMILARTSGGGLPK